MNGIIEVLGKQYNVKVGDLVSVDRMDKKQNDKIELDKVLMISKDNKVTVGDPFIKNAKVKATVVEDIRDDKVLVFKFKRKKNYQRLRGHKQKYTVIKIDEIVSA